MKKKTRNNKSSIARNKKTSLRNNEQLLDFDRYLEEIYLKDQASMKKIVKKKKKKINQAKTIGKSLLNIRFI